MALPNPGTLSKVQTVEAPPAVETQLAFVPALEELIAEAAQKQIELGPIRYDDPEKERERINAILSVTRQQFEQPRTVTGEAQDPAGIIPDATTSRAFVGQGAPFPANVIGALLPQDILSPEQYADQVKNFQESVIPDLYRKQIDAIIANPSTPAADLAKYDNDFFADAQYFKDEMIKNFGDRGQAFVPDADDYDPKTGEFKSGSVLKIAGNILGTEMLGYTYENLAAQSPAVKENITGTVLRDLLVAEAGLTAVGQEILDFFGADSVDGDNPNGLNLGQRWAENLANARGLEELGGDIGQTMGDSVQGAAQWFVDTTGLPGIAGPSDTSIKDLAEDPDFAENVSDAFWWSFLGGSFFLPIDAGAGKLTKLTKATAKAGTAQARATKGVGGTNAQAVQQGAYAAGNTILANTPVAARWANDINISDALGLDVNDLRVKEVSRQAANRPTVKLAEKLRKGEALNDTEKAFLDEAGIDASNPEQIKELFDEGVQSAVRFLDDYETIRLNDVDPKGALPDDPLPGRADVEIEAGLSPATARLATNIDEAPIGDGMFDIYADPVKPSDPTLPGVRDRVNGYKGVQPGDPNFFQKGFRAETGKGDPRARATADEYTGEPAGRKTKETFPYNKETAEVGDRFLDEMLAVRIRQRQAQRAINSGKNPISKNGVLLTPRIVVPKKDVNKVLRSVRTSEEGRLLAELIDTARKTGDINLTDFANALIKLRREIPELFKNGQASKTIINRMLARLDAIDEIAKEIGDEATSFNAAVRSKQVEVARGLGTLVDLMTEVQARKMLGPKVLDVADLEKSYVRASETVRGKAPTPEGPKPKLVQRVQAARTLERINDLVKPPELRRSRFGRAIAVTADVLFPNQTYINKFITFPGIKKPPVYSASLKRLRDRMGNLNEEFTTKMRRRMFDVLDNLEDYSRKLGIPVKEVRANRNVIAFGDLIEEQFGTTTAFAKQYVMAAFGIRDDIATAGIKADGTVDMTPYAMGKEKQLTQTVLEALFNMQDGPNILGELIEQTRGPLLNKFTPEFFEYLDGMTRILAGRTLDELAGDLPLLADKNITTRFDFDPKKTGSNVSGLLIDKARVNLLKEFSQEVTDTLPELFVSKTSPLKNQSRDFRIFGYTGGKPTIQSAMRKHGIDPNDEFKINTIEMILDYIYRGGDTGGIRPDQFDQLLQGALQDLITVKNGGDPSAARAVLEDVMAASLEPIFRRDRSMDATPRQIRDRFVEDLNADEISLLPNEEQFVTLFNQLVPSANVSPFENALVATLKDIIESDLLRNATTNKIFENYYLGTQTKNVSAADARMYRDQIVANLDKAAGQEMTKRYGGTGIAAGTKPVSFMDALEDLPFYVFDTAKDLKADIRNVLSDNKLLATYQTINATQNPQKLTREMLRTKRTPVSGRTEPPPKPARKPQGMEEFDIPTQVEGSFDFDKVDTTGKAVPDTGAIFPDGIFNKQDLNNFLDKVNDLDEFLKLVDDDPATSRLLRTVVNGIASGTGSLFGRWIPNVSKNGVLAGQLLLNPKYHMMNVLSMPAMVLSSIGPKKAGQAMKPNAMSANVLQNLNGYQYRKAGDSSFVITTPTGRTYDADQIADIVERNGINMSQATAEVRADIYRDFVRWTGENFGRFGREPKTVEFIREIGKGIERTFIGATGRTAWSELANATDNYFRVNVLISALQDGASEAQAVKLAREAMYDYNNLTKFERDVVMKGIWIYAFRAQSYRRVMSNAINNPTRLLQSYKLVKGVNNEEDEGYRPFMSRYKNSKMFLGIYDDPDTRSRYALFGPDVPVIDAFDDIASATYSFGAMLKGVTEGDVAGLGRQIDKQGQSILSQTSPVVRIPLTLAGYELSFGEIRDASTYIPPAYIYFLKRTGNWEAFKVFYNVKARTPRTGKPTIDGLEWGIDRKDKAARRNWLLLKEGALLLGFQRNIREWSTIVEQIDPQDSVKLSTQEAPGDLGLLPTDLGSSTGALTVEEVPNRQQQELNILNEIKYGG